MPKANEGFLKGFTLIELLIAASIAAVLGLAIVATFAAGFKTYKALKDGNLAQADALLSFERMQKDLRNTFHFSRIDFTGDQRNVSFAGFIHGGPAIGRISYVFDAAKGQLIKTEQPYSYALLNNSAEGIDSQVVASLKDAAFSYYSFNPKTAQYGWDDSFDASGGIPMQVRITAIFQEGQETFERQKIVPIPVAE